MKYKMQQVMYPCVQPWTELFFDGEVKVVDNIVEFDHEHWRDILFMRGFVDYVEEPEVIEEPEAPVTAEEVAQELEKTPEPSPKKKRTNRKASKSAR